MTAPPTLAEVEDLYRPYKQKRRTRATVAREKGLEPLAQLLLAQGRDCPDPEDRRRRIPGSGKGCGDGWPTPSRGPTTSWRSCCRTMPPSARPCGSCCARQGRLRSLAATEEDTVYRLYYDFDQPIAKLAGHQILAINRGEKEGVLSVTVLLDRELGLHASAPGGGASPASRAMEFIKAACEDAYDRLIYPSLEREARVRSHRSRPARGPSASFALNLKPLLMQPPVKGKVTMGLDPGYAARAARWRWWTAPAGCWTPPWCIPPTVQRQKQEAISRPGPADTPPRRRPISPSATAPPAGRRSRWRWS